MPEMNLALQLQPVDGSTVLESVMIGESRFTDDIWDLKAYIPAKTLQESHKLLYFGYIKNAAMKHVIKQYAYYKLGKVKPMTVITIIVSRIPCFIAFCAESGISSFADLTKEDFLAFNLWLKEKKKVSDGYGQHCAHAVEEIIKIGQIKGWDVPQSNILRGVSPSQLWARSKEQRENRVKPIPPDIFDKILYHAVHDEKDVLTKAGIIVQSQTGLRINEVLSIQEGCVKTTSDGYDYMEVLLSKTEKGDPIIHRVFVNELVKNTIRELSDYTVSLRKESGMKELFLTRKCGIRVLNINHWTTYRLSNFIKRWDIRDNKGELYHLRSHQFRATYVRELVKQKIPIAMIMKQYAHVSVEMTAHYLTLQTEEIKEIYSDMIFSPESKIAGLRAKEIKGKLDYLFHGKTREEIESVIAELTRTMSFNPLPTGVCLYDFRRGNCADGDGCFMYNCPNYITEVQFYPILRKELDLLECEMTRLKELGYDRQWQVEYVKYKYLKPLVDELEVQLHEESA